ncbi:hypothetical protein CANARDRAFT_29286 [[Candida] arabinofermentans NRRL YB-2248]|uniref:Uncharacterized protein n=1 Tax=[Candida] arabinofermentans NRRL YB-2248 TaxID=983967 RepID=A0A1E4SX89_9ASCO|nr:hypothetical protein CANARDRAFT_29286 [[Candida] arabinofermentans NRRL YB-2248]
MVSISYSQTSPDGSHIPRRGLVSSHLTPLLRQDQHPEKFFDLLDVFCPIDLAIL